MTEIPPSIGCPTCAFILTVVDDFCPICGSTFAARELWELYERQVAAANNR